MNQIKIEGGILEESLIFKQENPNQEIVEIFKEDIRSDEDEVGEDGQDRYNTDIIGDSQQIKIKSENVADTNNYELERNSEANCGVTIFKEEKEDSDILNGPVEYETNLKINSQNTSSRNETMEFFKTQQLLLRVGNDKKDLYNNPIIIAISESRHSNTDYNNKESKVSKETKVKHDKDQGKAKSIESIKQSYNNKGSTVSRETKVNYDKYQGKAKSIEQLDPFACNSDDDDDDIFGNDWEMESSNNNPIGTNETARIRETPMEKDIINSPQQKGDKVQEKQLLENNKKSNNDPGKIKAKPIQQDMNDKSGSNCAGSYNYGRDTQETAALRTQEMKSKSSSQILGTPRTIVPNVYTNMLSSVAVLQDTKELLEKRATLITKNIVDYEFKEEGNNEYRCNHCQAIIIGEKEIKGHIRQNHRKIPKCPYCQKEVSKLDIHINHMHAAEKDVKYYRCDRCDYKAKSKSHLVRHKVYKHTEREEMMDRIQTCGLCFKTFKLKRDLVKHEKSTHKMGTEYRCAHCDFTNFNRTAFTSHLEEHMNPEKLKTHKCTHCDFTTPYRDKYRRHMLKHREKNWQCHLCTYRAKSEDHLKLHLISHKKVKDEKDWKFKCDKCNYKTYRPYNLQIHKLNHLKPEEIEYFYCYHCSFKAKRKDNLKSHIYRHFKQEQVPFQCFICNFTTQNRDELIRHIDEHVTDQNKKNEFK